VVAGSSRAPIAITSLRRETLADMSRGRLRGWALLGAILLAVFAALSWPYLLGVLVFLAAAAACIGAFVWIQWSLRDAERRDESVRDPSTGERD